MNIRPLPDTPRLRLDLARRDWLQFVSCPGRHGQFLHELELCDRAIAKSDPNLKPTGVSSWGTGRRVEPKRPLLLDLFCGAGGAAMGYYRAGFDVIGIDYKPQPRYPFRFLQADLTAGIPWDALRETFGITPGDVAAYHASPPCQRFSASTPSINRDKHPDLIASTRKILKFTGKPYVIENVPRAPLQNALMLCGTMFNLMVIRHRLFECSQPVYFAPHTCRHDMPLARQGTRPKTGEMMTVTGNFVGKKEASEAMGIDWMVSRELKEAIPPAYTEYIGRHLIAHLERQSAPSGGERVSGLEVGQGICEAREARI